MSAFQQILIYVCATHTDTHAHTSTTGNIYLHNAAILQVVIHYWRVHYFGGADNFITNVNAKWQAKQMASVVQLSNAVGMSFCVCLTVSV